MRREVVALAFAGLMIGIPGVAGDDDNDSPHGPLEEILTVIGDDLAEFDVGCFDFEFGQFSSADYDVKINIEGPNLYSKSATISLPVFFSSDPAQYIELVRQVKSGDANDYALPPDWIQLADETIVDTLLLVGIGESQRDFCDAE